MANAYERHDISDESWSKIELLLPSRKGTWAVMRVITGNLSMPCFGFCGQERLGVTCRQTMATGKIPINVFAVGVTRERGSGYWRN